jgi:alpha-amylase
VKDIHMQKKIAYGLALIAACFSLFACSPSQARLDAHATQVAASIYATITAAPTSTSLTPPSPTDTPSTVPTSTDTPLITEMVLQPKPVAPVTKMPQGTDGFPWWNDSIFYEIFVRSFYDSDGDGIGDINGIIQKLDYLNDGDPSTTTDLGITGIWLMPINPSPSYHGYSVTDYYDINPEYGTMDDFKNLLEAAHARGIRVIMDLVLNHTSNQHPWFINAGNPNSPYHDWYIWSSFDPGYSGSWGQKVWFPSNGRYFYSTFSANMPDLNYNNPGVNEQMRDVVRFWLEEVGVDGFRLDAAKHIIEEGTIQANSASTHTWWQNFRPFYKQINPQALIVGEIWEDTAINAEYLQGDEFDLSFEFSLAFAFLKAVSEENHNEINEQIRLSDRLIPSHQYATFLSNHDLERVMSHLQDNEDMAKVAASLLLTAPGVPFLYYGEEIGMQGDQIHEWFRRPMQWSNELYGGFSIAPPWEILGPGWESYNVSLQMDDPTSILSHYRNLIRTRNQHAALRVGDLQVLSTTNKALYSILRVSQDEIVLVLINLSEEPVTEVWLAKSDSNIAEGSYIPVPILGEEQFSQIPVDAKGGFFHKVSGLVIPPYGTYILQLQPIDP